jgi:alginate O-acetyltransferase complex protein AlgI
VHDTAGPVSDRITEFETAAPSASLSVATAVREPTAAARERAEVAAPRTFALLALQVAALLLVVDRFHIESEAFLRLFALAAGGFVFHYFLPLRHRLPFFVALSLTGLCLVLGVRQGGWVIAIGLTLIGLAHLPIPVSARALLLVVFACVLALPRWGVGHVPWSAAVWPILGSMFVFRLIVYLYDLSHNAGPSRVSQTLGYFFLLPNVCFPLFPVVDFRKFCRNYYDADRHEIYQVGIEWIWRGLIHLLAYRVIYYHLTIESIAVANLGDLVFYMITTFLLYVRISGQFHVIVGILHLFGFNLPESHHRYFLASSFTDFWRRINIYWKDFMMKIFYYPAYFRFRKLGATRALVLATIFTFVSTWFLHMVQWFWIRGSVFRELTDIIFWAIFAALVLANSLYEAKHGRSRIPSTRNRTLAESVSLVLRTVGTFTVICLLWTFWTSESISDWVLLCRNALTLPSWSGWQYAAIAAGVAAATAMAIYGTWQAGPRSRQGTFARVSARTILATTAALSLLTVPGVIEQMGSGAPLIASLRATSLNRRDAEQFQRGYYEQLLAVSKLNAELRRIYDKMPADFARSLDAVGLSRPTGDEQDYVLVPLKAGRFMGEMVQTNRWGMRDTDYPQSPDPGTYRIALTGPSTAMGSGVKAAETFEALLEERLNREGRGRRYEILNFGVAGYSPLHMLFQLEKKVFLFQPRTVLYLGHYADLQLAAVQLIRMVGKGIVPSGSYLEELVQRAGLRKGMGATESRRRIRPYADELIAWVYTTFVAECAKRNVHPVFVYFETVTESTEPWRVSERTKILAAAEAAGFTTINLVGVYRNQPPATLWVVENDGHPNALGSRLIAEQLYADLIAKSDVLELGLTR